MEKKIFSIPNISCGHCVKTITDELGEIKGVSNVQGDPAKKAVTVEWDSPASLDKILSVLKEINFPAAS